MEYAVGRTGRIIAARLFEGEDLYESIHEIARAESIKSAAVLITGGFRRANVVVGPVQEEPKIVPDFKDFTGPGEVLGGIRASLIRRFAAPRFIGDIVGDIRYLPLVLVFIGAVLLLVRNVFGASGIPAGSSAHCHRYRPWRACCSR